MAIASKDSQGVQDIIISRTNLRDISIRCEFCHKEVKSILRMNISAPLEWRFLLLHDIFANDKSSKCLAFHFL